MMNSRMIPMPQEGPCDLCDGYGATSAQEMVSFEKGVQDQREPQEKLLPPSPSKALTIAAMQGRLGHVLHWIEHAECDVNSVDEMGTTALHRAAQEGHIEIIRYLLHQGTNLHDRVLDESKDTALHIAVKKGHTAVVMCLLEAGAAIEARNAANDTPLLAAIRSNHLHVVEVLIAKGASISAPCLLVLDGDDKNKTRDVGTCLHLAVQCGHVALTKFLVSIVAMDANQSTRCRNVTPLHFAARHGHMELVQFLISRQHANVHARDARGMTPLHYAVDYDYDREVSTVQQTQIERTHAQIVVFLLKSGAKVKPRRARDHATPLRCAAKRGRFHISKTLLAYGARSSTTTAWLFALVWARGDPSKVKDLVSCSKSYSVIVSSTRSLSAKSRSSVSSEQQQQSKATKDDHEYARESLASSGTATQPESPPSSSRRASILSADGCTALHTACRDANWRLLNESLYSLASRSSTGNSTEQNELEACLLPEGLTPLHLASRRGWVRGVALLLQCGANVHAATISSGSTSLHFAAERGHVRIMGFLLSHGCSPTVCDHAGVTPLLLALRNGRSHAMKYLLRHGDAGLQNEASRLNNAPKSSSMGIWNDAQLHLPLPSMYHDDMESKEDELVRKFNPKCTTALHLAAFYGFLETAKQLVWDGEDVDALDHDGATPVWIAALMGHLDIVAFLTEQGANVNVVTKNGMSVAQNAAEFGHLELLAFLSSPTPDAAAHSLSERRLSLTRVSLQDQSSSRLSWSLSSLSVS
ncbi:Wd repeat-containing protein 1-b, partial [Globisporangium splendens]